MIIWDKLFGTFVEENPDITIKYGIIGELPRDNPISTNFKQVSIMLKQLSRAKGVRQKLSTLFGYPFH